MATEPAGPATGWQAATIVARERLTPRIVSFTLRPQRWLRPRAGQHVDVRLTAPDGYQARRSYSLTSPPERPEVYEIAVELLPDGEVSPYFHEVAAPGDVIEIRGPLGGHFVWDAGETGPVLLAGGGSGLAPLVAMARHRAAAGQGAPMLLLAGARAAADIMHEAELRTLDAGIVFRAALSREAPAHAGDLAGRLDGASIAAALAAWGHSPARSYVCGSNRFVETVAGALVALGLPPGSIRTERYGGA